MTAPVTVTRLHVTSDRCYKGLHYIEGAPFRISFWTLATDIDPAEGVRRLRFADDLVAAWNTRHAAEAASKQQIAELVEVLVKMLPANLCLTNRTLPDDMNIPLEWDVTMGELREVAALLARAKATEQGEG